MKLAAILIFTSVFSGQVAFAMGPSPQHDPAPFPEFGAVSEGLYRGGRPLAAGIDFLAQKGVRKIVDLEDDASAIADERGWSAEKNIPFFSFPLSAFAKPDRAEVDEILLAISQRADGPVFVHCQHGEDRTGMIIGIYRVLYEHWTPAAARAEMGEYHFHPELFPLADFFHDVTGG